MTEKQVVQKPLLKYAEKAGWEYVPPQQALALRKGPTGKFFYDILKLSLIKLNPGFLTSNNVEELLRQINSLPDTIEGNKAHLNWIKGHQTYFDAKEKRHCQVKMIDFENAENNTFQVTEEWTFTNPHKTNRPDVMFLINGLPLALVENKKPGVTDSMEQALAQIKRLESETPEILSCTQVFNITDAFEYFYGVTWNYTRKNVFNWKVDSRFRGNDVLHKNNNANSSKKLHGNDDISSNEGAGGKDTAHRNDGVSGNDDANSGNDGATNKIDGVSGGADVYAKGSVQGNESLSFEQAVLSFFNKTHFLKMINQWVLFYLKEGELQKTILRQHQTRAVEKINQRCKTPSKNRGLVWHTQGSGKTFTMITAARLILQSQANSTVLMIVDRNELEGQLYEWIERIITEMKNTSIAIKKAYSKTDLLHILKSDFRGLIISMIHKFKDIPANICTRDNFYVFMDEAHRSVEGDLGNYLTGALPKATLIGFTGTPIDKTNQGQGTFKVFGKYDKEGYLDKYSIAESIEDGTTLKIKYSLAPNTLTVKDQLLEKEFFNITDTEGISDIETLNKILTRSVNLRTFLKSVDRIKAVSRFVAHHFKENVKPLGYKAFLVAVDREACAFYKKELDQHLAPEASQVVYTKSHNDSALLKKYHINTEEEHSVRKLFKKPACDPEILIVTDKLLTGYDAPLLYCMYMDKPMRDHVLLQAMARVNRPYEDAQGIQKPCGLIVDFVGVFKSMKKALTFDSGEVNAVIEDLNVMMQKFKSMITKDLKPYLTFHLKTYDKLLEQFVYEKMRDPQKRQRFSDQFQKLQALYEILSPDAELRPYIKPYQHIVDLYLIVQKAYRKKTDFIAEVTKKTQALIQNTAHLKFFKGIVKIYSIDEHTLKHVKSSNDLDSKKVIDLIQSIRKETEEHSREKPHLISISERADQIMQNFEESQQSSSEALKHTLKLVDEAREAEKLAQNSSLSLQEATIAWPLKKQKLKQFEDLAVQMSESFDKFTHFYSSSEEKRQLKMDLYQILLKTVPEDKIVKLTEEIITSVEATKK